MSKAYIDKTFKVTSRQYDWLKKYASNLSLNKHTFHFFCHLIKSTITQVRQYRAWIPISSVLIKNHFWEADILKLQELRLIQVKSHERRLNRTREYKISPLLLLEYMGQNVLLEFSNASVREYLEEDKVNLFTGRKLDPFQRSKFYDDSRNAEPKLIVDSIKAIRYSLYNQDALLAHMRELKGEYEQYRVNEDFGFEHKLFDFILDLHCFESILSQRPVSTDKEGIYSYTPAYKIQSTGRIQAIGGGLQSCSKRMKLAAYSGIEGLEIFDIAASHANIILSHMENAGIRCEWLEEYLASPTEKYQYAEQIGLKYSTWKRCLYALLMGAPFRETLDSPINSIRGYIAMDVEYDEIETTYQKFLNAVEPLRMPLNDWYEYLFTAYVPKISKNVIGKTYIRNPVGKVRQLKGSLTRGQLAAFIVQGFETAFIHHLTILSNKYRYVPINNEHDALYVIGHIPQQAIAEAKSLTGLRFLQVSQKAIEF